MSGRRFWVALAVFFSAISFVAGCASAKKKAPEPQDPRVEQCIDIVQNVYSQALVEAYAACVMHSTKKACETQDKACRAEITTYCRTATKLYAYDLIAKCLQRTTQEI